MHFTLYPNDSAKLYVRNEKSKAWLDGKIKWFLSSACNKSPVPNFLTTQPQHILHQFDNKFSVDQAINHLMAEYSTGMYILNKILRPNQGNTICNYT